MEQVTKLCEVEEERLAFSTSNKGLPQYDQAYALGKSTIDMQRIAAGLPCGSESFLLMSARWKKLEHDIYSERRKWVPHLWFVSYYMTDEAPIILFYLRLESAGWVGEWVVVGALHMVMISTKILSSLDTEHQLLR